MMLPDPGGGPWSWPVVAFMQWGERPELLPHSFHRPVAPASANRMMCIAVHISDPMRIRFSVITIVTTFHGLTAVEKALSIALVNHEAQSCTIAGDVCFCIVDLIIAGSISYLLYRNRTGFAKTERILNTLTLYIVTTGMIDSTLRLLRIVLTIAYPGSLYMLIPYILTPRAYTNTILATLNSRNGRCKPPSKPIQQLSGKFLRGNRWKGARVSIEVVGV